jgi:regulator of RNase E activity RraB
MSIEPAWEAYERHEDGNRGITCVDTRWAAEECEDDRAARPTAVRVVFTYEGGEEGLPEEEMLDAFLELEDTLATEMEENRDAAFTGVKTLSGHRTLLFYMNDVGDISASLMKLVQAPEGSKMEVSVQEDPDWSQYEQILPSLEESRKYFDSMLLAEVEEHVEDMSQPRLIEHMAFFPDEASAKSFAAWAKGEGYQVEAVRKAETEELGDEDEENEEEDTDDVFAVAFKGRCALTIEAVSERTIAAEIAAEEHGGMYDGWEVEVDKSEPPRDA